MFNRAAVAMALVMLSPLNWASGPAKPAPPPDVVPDLAGVIPSILCVDCDEPFDTSTHKRVLEELAASPYVAELRSALYRQDILHQFASRAHYDNCDFDSANAYVVELLDEADGHVTAAEAGKNSGDKAKMEASALKAFFAIGQALHAVQDFYAHSNYVELQVPKAKRIVDIEVIAPWRPRGQQRIAELREQGLHSGYVFWGVPQRCPDVTPSHGDLAKDSATTKSGSRRVAHLQNVTQYQVAVFLAREASLALMTDAFRRWPLLKELNGQHVAFEVLTDRRGIDAERK